MKIYRCGQIYSIILYLFTSFIKYSSCSSTKECVVSGDSRVIGGYNVSISRVPYQAQIVQEGKHLFCGAVIISPYWLLSAAHCFYRNRNNVAVRIGSTYKEQGEIHEIKKIIVHEKFNRSIIDNDICLILLSKPIKFNQNQMAIKISSKELQSGDVITISGYGRTSVDDKKASPVVKLAFVPFVEQKTCAGRYNSNKITDNMFCAGLGETDSCHGDSGGPVTIANELVGLVSWGYDCASKYYPGVYTKVYNYRSWISNITNIKL